MTECAAMQESLATVTSNATDPVWHAPTATVIPPTPTTEAIPNPLTSAESILESSGGSSTPDNTQGGAPTLADCMALWDPAVHMSKVEWRTTCTRTLNGTGMSEVAVRSNFRSN